MLPKIVDTKFLNEKASKAKTFTKKVKQILDLGEEEFSKNPMYPDRTKYYLVVLADELEAIACHLLEVYFQQKFTENCLEKLAKEEILDAKLSRSLYDLAKLKQTFMEKSLTFTPENLYHTAKDIITTLDSLLIPQLAGILKELKEKAPKLKIPVNLKKINQHISAIKTNISKLDTFLKYPQEEFIKSPMFVDRSRYFMVVAIDSANWICKHVVRKLGEKSSENCFIKLYEKGIIDKETAQYLQNLSNIREDIANPTKDINLNEFYNKVKTAREYFTRFYKDVLKNLLEKEDNGKQ